MTRPAEVAFPVAVVAMVVLTAGAPLAVAGPEEPTDRPVVDVDHEGDPPTVSGEPVATVDGRRFASASAAVDAADPGDEVVLNGRFDERLVVDTNDVTLLAGERGAVLDGGGEGDVLVVAADGVTVEGLWIRDSGYDVDQEDAGVFVDGNDTTLRDLYVSNVAYGVWVDGVDRVAILDSRIEGREDVFPVTDRGNGIHLWQTENTTVRNNEIVAVRDGIYYSWAEHVVATNNAIRDSRFGVHYMYSNDNRLANNTAVDNDVGFALMVSERLTVEDNVAVGNDGTSGHGVLLKDIERSEIRGNDLVANGHGLYVYNAQDNAIEDNLLFRNGVGIHTTAGSDGQRVVANSFVGNDRPVLTTTTGVAVWNGSDRGNYWSDATAADLDGDGTSEVRHRPAGAVERLVLKRPQAAVFAESPAFEAVRLAESSFPVVESPGVVDRRPLVESPHDWRRYEAVGYADRSPAEGDGTDPVGEHDHRHDGDDSGTSANETTTGEDHDNANHG